LLVFHAYINGMQVQEAKSQVQNLVRQRCVEGFNSGIKRLMYEIQPRPEIYSQLLEVYGEDAISWQSVTQQYVHFRVERVITEDMVC
jgi:hypothetical protein